MLLIAIVSLYVLETCYMGSGTGMATCPSAKVQSSASRRIALAAALPQNFT